MDINTDESLWTRFESDMRDDTEYTDAERSAWLDFLRLSKMTNTELLVEATEIDKVIEEEALDDDVRAVLRSVSARYWDVYSLRLATDLSNLTVK
jgi:hypothetical protein